MPKRRHIIILLSLTLLLLAFWRDGLPGIIGLEGANAQPATFTGIQPELGKAMSLLLTIFNVLTFVLFTILHFLLDPAFIFDIDQNGNSPLLLVLNTIWQLSRDLMNVIFAVMLIGAAIYTIITAKKDLVATYLPKFVAIVILVNFSWFIPRVILDVSNVLTATVYGIPQLLNVPCRFRSSDPLASSMCSDEIGDGQTYICDCEIISDVQFFLDPTKPEDNAILTNGAYKCTGRLVCYRKRLMSEVGNLSGLSAMLNGLVINHGMLPNLAIVPNPGAVTNTIGEWITFIVKQAILLLMSVGLFFPLAAMTVAFVIRIPVLWITIAFMPFILLGWLGGEKLGAANPKQIWDQFLKAAFLPVLVAIPLSVGYIMLNAAAPVVFSPLNNINFRILDEIGNIWQLLWLVMAFGVMWVGVFTVLKSAGIMSTGAQAIRNFGSSAGRFAAKLPLAAPVIPGLGVSPLQLASVLHPRNLESELLRAKGLGGGDGLGGRIMDRLRGGGSGSSVRPVDVDDAARKIGADATLKNDLKREIDKALAANNRAGYDTLRTYLKDKGIVSDTNKVSGADLHHLLDELQKKHDIGISDASKNLDLLRGSKK